MLNSPVAQGLLAGGLGAMASRGSTMQALGRGGLLGMQVYGQAAGQQQNRLIEEAKKLQQQQALASLKPREGGGFTTDRMADLLQFMKPDEIQTALNLGRDKFKQMQEVTNADGSKSLYGVNEFGGINSTGLTNAPEIKTQDLGGAVVGVNPYTGQQAWDAQKTATIAELEAQRHNRASEGLTLRSQNLTDARARDSNQAAKAPAGYRWSPDGQSLIAIPGGPADKGSSATEGERKAATLLQRLEGSKEQLEKALGERSDAAKPNVITSLVRSVGMEPVANTITNEQRQRVEAAQLDLLDAALTLGTGAAYTREQLEGYRKSYFPQLGDSAGTVKDKQARLENVVESARIAAGRAAPDKKPKPQAPNERSVVRTGVFNGRKVVQYSDGSTAYAD